MQLLIKVINVYLVYKNYVIVIEVGTRNGLKEGDRPALAITLKIVDHTNTVHMINDTRQEMLGGPPLPLQQLKKHLCKHKLCVCLVY